MQLLKDTKHHIWKYQGFPLNVGNISLNEMWRNNRYVLFLSQSRWLDTFWFIILWGSIIFPLLCGTITWMYKFHKCCKSEFWKLRILHMNSYNIYNQQKHLNTSAFASYTAHQDIHAKACHISLCQYVEISSCRVQQIPEKQKRA